MKMKAFEFYAGHSIPAVAFLRTEEAWVAHDLGLKEVVSGLPAAP